jgi:hypothetical protein
MTKRLIPVVLGAVLSFAALPLTARTLVVGSPPDNATGNCYPFGCAYNGQYQQVYTHTLFSEPVVINALQFSNTEENEFAGDMNSGAWAVSLSTTPADWNTLSADFSSNVGPDNKTVFIGNLARPWAFGDTLTILLTTPFSYDPAKGNLLIHIVATGTSDLGGNIFFNTNGNNDGGHNGNQIFGRAYCPGGTNCGDLGDVDAGYGLETGFSIRPKSDSAASTPSSVLWTGETPEAYNLLPFKTEPVQDAGRISQPGR